MNKFKLSIIQNKIIRDKKQNLSRALSLLNTACDIYNPDILVLPEMFTYHIERDGNPYTYAEYENKSETLDQLRTFVIKRNVHLIGGSIPIKIENSKKVYNSTYCLDNKGEIKANYQKQHLFDVDIPNKVKFTESDTVIEGDKSKFLTVFETPFAKFGIGICYDIRFGEQVHLLKSIHNIDCMVYPSAFSFQTGQMHWDLLRRARALDNNVFVVMASPSRNYHDLSYFQVWGYSSIVNPFGEVINSAGYEEGIINSEIDLDLVKSISEQIPCWKHKKKNLYEVVYKNKL